MTTRIHHPEDALTGGHWGNRGGIRVWVPDTSRNATERILRSQGTGRVAMAERIRWAAERAALIRRIDTLTALVASPNRPHVTRGWFCPIDGCWCLPLEDCPACKATTTTKENT